jgi:predicted nucleic acid-binding protein
MVLLVLDTSVILKWFKEEEYTKTALKIKKEFIEGVHELVVPDLALYELVNAMRFSEGFDEETIKKSLEKFIDLEIDIVIPTQEVINSAIKLSYTYNITVYDAVFVSLAKLIGAIFVTADEKLHEKIKKLKFVKFITEF